ncbi:MAG: hypothetical protein AAF587_44940 [Bacteroidota bacterium]
MQSTVNAGMLEQGRLEGPAPTFVANFPVSGSIGLLHWLELFIVTIAYG